MDSAVKPVEPPRTAPLIATLPEQPTPPVRPVPERSVDTEARPAPEAKVAAEPAKALPPATTSVLVASAPLLTPEQIALTARARFDSAITEEHFRRISGGGNIDGTLSEEITAAPISDRFGAHVSRGYAAEAVVRTDTGTSVAQQLSAAVQKSGPGQYEVTLNPAELGRVRISMEAQEGGMHVTIHAERTETADLIRRNIDQLERSLRELGYDALGFSFGGSGQGERESAAGLPGQADGTDGTGSASAEAETTGMVPLGRDQVRAAGLDLRL